MPGTRKIGRKTDHRLAMLKGMSTYLLEYGKIETTVTRAKEVSALTDRMITLGKANTLASRRQAMAFLKKESVVSKLFNDIAPAYSERNGGYTRVLKIGPRRGDGAEMAIVVMVDAEGIYGKASKEDAKAKDKDAKKAAKAEPEKKPAAKKKADKAAEAAPAEAPAESAAAEA